MVHLCFQSKQESQAFFRKPPNQAPFKRTRDPNQLQERLREAPPISLFGRDTSGSPSLELQNPWCPAPSLSGVGLNPPGAHQLNFFHPWRLYAIWLPPEV